MKTVKCNRCGKNFGYEDFNANFCLHKTMPYGSKYDGDNLNVDLCCDCFDYIIDSIRSVCKYDIIQDNDECPTLLSDDRKCFVRDDDGHWYAILVKDKDEFYTWSYAMKNYVYYQGKDFDGDMLPRHISEYSFSELLPSKDDTICCA